MKKLILFLCFIQIINIQIVKSQCGISSSTYNGVGTTTANLVPVFSNTNGCIKNSQIEDDNTNVHILTGSLILNSNLQSYAIVGVPFLWCPGNTSNTFVGSYAGNGSLTGTENTLVGYNAGNAIIGGNENVCIGSNAGKSITEAEGNICIGSHAGFYLTDYSPDNTFVGHWAGENTNSGGVIPPPSLGAHNSFFGDESGRLNTIGSYNTAIGSYSMHENLTGINNSCLGYGAGYQNKTGENNTFLGTFADCGPSSTSLINATSIGYSAIVISDNTMILCDNDVTVYFVDKST